MKKFLLVIALAATAIFQSNPAKAQLEQIETILRSGSEDMTTYMEAYTQPFLKGFAYGLSNGWYNTAETHKSLGFDLTVTGSLATVPESDFFFDFVASDYNSLTLLSGDSQLPTLVGPTTNSQLEASGTYTDESTGMEIGFNEVVDALDGIQEDLPGSNKVPVPMIQLGVGTVKNTELIVRYAPSVDVSDFSLTFFGIGLKHDIRQWIPGIRSVPIDLSILVGYTNLDTDYDLSGNEFTENGVADFDVNAWTVQAIVSKKLSVLTLYGAIGFNTGQTNFIMSGDYIFDSTTPGFELQISDPVNIESSVSGGTATVGARLKLAIFTFHADYTFKEYNVLTAGFGISVR